MYLWAPVKAFPKGMWRLESIRVGTLMVRTVSAKALGQRQTWDMCVESGTEAMGMGTR